MPPQFQPKLSRLHRTLAWRPDEDSPNAAGLNIRVHAMDDGIHAEVNGNDFRLSDNPADRAESYVRKFAAMLAHYPAAVVINDQPIDTTPYRAEPGIRFSRYTGELLNPGHASGVVVQGHFRPTILLNHVLYELGAHSVAGHDATDYLNAHFAVPDRQDGQLHFARRTSYTVTPCYWSDASVGPARRERRWEFRNSSRDGLYICCPPPDVMQALVMYQREQQEKEAIAIIKNHAGASPIGNPIRSKWDYHNSPDELRSHSNDQSVPLVIYGAPAYVDLGNRLDQAAAQTIARALYATPTLDLVPVQHRIGGQALPSISCERVTVITGTGETLTLTHNHDGIRPDFTPEHSKTTHWQETGCRSITAHLTVTDPDGGVRYADLPMDILCAGYIDVEIVWLTNAWTPELEQQLEELLFLAYWPAHDPPEETSERQYREQAEALAVALLHGNKQGLIRELQQHSDNFYSQSNCPELAAVTVANARHSFIWQPRGDDDTPVWLTAAIAGQNPELSGAAVREHARSIVNDPSRHAALRALLEP